MKCRPYTWKNFAIAALVIATLVTAIPGAGAVPVVRSGPSPTMAASVTAVLAGQNPAALPQIPDPDSLEDHLDELAGELDELPFKMQPVVARSYHADITIHPEGYFDVREEYEVQFNQPRHGIYRTIPLRTRLATDPTDVSTPSLRGFVRSLIFPAAGTRDITIDHVEVPGHPVETGKQHLAPPVLSIRIGSPDRYVEGIQRYTIQYRVKNAFLFEDSVTYFYWNLLGDKWEFPFYNASFTVHLSGDPDAKAFVYTGLRGDTTADATYSYQHGVFSGRAAGVLGEGRDMTLLLHLPPDYIRRPGVFSVWYDHYGWSLFCLGAMFLFLLAWYRWGRDNKPVKAVEYFPPPGMDPAMAGFLADERVHNRDLTSLIPYWGARGLISMEEGDPKSKGTLGLQRGQRAKMVIGIVFLAIFLIIFWSGGSALFRATGQGGGFFGMLLPLLFVAFPFVFIAGRTLFKSWRKKDLILYKKGELPSGTPAHEDMMFRGLFGAGDTVHISTLKNTFYTTLNEAKAALGKHCRGMFFTRHSRRNVVITAVLCVLAAFVGGIWLAVAFNITGGVMFFITCIGLSFYSGAMSRRVVRGDEALRQVEGFRLFIRKARKRELEMLVRDHPGYFEDTLAYALAFGLAEKYGKKFDGLMVKPPEWYSGNGSHFTVRSFSSSFNSAMTSTAQTLVSSPSSSGSGGSSGGGSSGGGFGGGGGGSW